MSIAGSERKGRQPLEADGTHRGWAEECRGTARVEMRPLSDSTPSDFSSRVHDLRLRHAARARDWSHCQSLSPGLRRYSLAIEVNVRSTRGLMGSARASGHSRWIIFRCATWGGFFRSDSGTHRRFSRNSLQLNGARTSWTMSHSSWLVACQLPSRSSHPNRIRGSMFVEGTVDSHRSKASIAKAS